MKDLMSSLVTRRLTIHPAVAVVVILSVLLLMAADRMLWRHNHTLRSALQNRVSSMAPQVGTLVPDLRGLTPDGQPITVDYSGDPRETLLLVFSTDCPLSTANWPYWEAIARQIDIDRFRLVYANLSDSLSEDYLRSHDVHPDALVLAAVDPQSVVDYTLGLTPLLLLIDADATISSVWLGVTKDGSRQEMEAALSIMFTLDDNDPVGD